MEAAKNSPKKSADPVRTVERMVLQTSDVLSYNGVNYIKLAPMKSRIEMISGTEKRRATLWICMEQGQRFPCQTVIVPEYI